jgi:hypothetical protein
MMKPVVIAPLVALALAAGTAGAYFWVTSEGGEEEAAVAEPTPTPTPAAEPSATPSAVPTEAPTPAPEGQLYRWVNVTVVIPEGSGIVAGPDYGGTVSSGGTLAFRIDWIDREYPYEASSYVIIDADNGAILSQEVVAERRAAIDDVLASLEVSPLDTRTALWPYSDEPSPDLTRGNFGGMSFLRPDPSTGLYVSGGIGDPGGVFVDIRNGRSAAFVLLKDGRLSIEKTEVVPEDVEVFDRWLATVKLCGVDIQC